MDTGIRERGARKGRDGVSAAGRGKGTPFSSVILPQAPTSKGAAPTTLNSSSQVINNQPLERFDSRGHHLYKFIVAKENVYIRKESNSHKRGLEHLPPTG